MVKHIHKGKEKKKKKGSIRNPRTSFGYETNQRAIIDQNNKSKSHR